MCVNVPCADLGDGVAAGLGAARTAHAAPVHRPGLTVLAMRQEVYYKDILKLYIYYNNCTLRQANQILNLDIRPGLIAQKLIQFKRFFFLEKIGRVKYTS